MSTPLPQHLQIIVETICSDGCTHANEVIEALSEKRSTEEIKDLSEPDKEVVLTELQTVMAVYKTGQTKTREC